MNTFGTLFTLTTAGESHGPALTGIIDGMPAGIRIDFDRIRLEMARRRPGRHHTTARTEDDEVTFLSGLLDGVTLGTPIAFIIPNTDTRPSDYTHLASTFRPSHADYTYQAKYGIRDVRGGGRSSARETALRVVGGALALQALERRGVNVEAFTLSVGGEEIGQGSEAESRLEQILEDARRDGDTLGCEIGCIVTGLPAGVGEPIYDKLSARLAYAMMSINAAHAFGYGYGASFGHARGSETADIFEVRADGSVGTRTNYSGGIQGGISNGMPVEFSVTFKPLPTLMRPMPSINAKGEEIKIEPRGRHDVCAAPRAVAVVRAMAAMTVLDMLLQYDARRFF